MNIGNKLINLLLVLVALEFTGNVAYLYLNGSLFYRDKLAAITADPAETAQPQKTEPDPNRLWQERQVIHPYLGFVDDLDHLRQRGEDKSRTKLGFLKFDNSPDFPFYAENSFNVAIFGGSVAASVCGSFAKTKEQLLKLEATEHKTIVLYCFALGGKKQPDQMQTLSYLYTLGAHFDIVINLDGFNEVTIPLAENYAKGVNPFFPRSWQLQAAPSPLKQRLAFLNRIGEISRGAVESPYNWSALITSFAQLADRLSAKEANNAVTDYYRSSGHYPFAQSGPVIEFASPESQWEELARMWARASLAMNALTQAMGGQYFHFLQPNQYFGFKKLTATEQAEAFTDQHPYQKGVVNGYPRLLEYARLLADRLVFTDLTKIYQNVTETIYSDDCCHTNRRGYEILATAIGTIIVANWRTTKSRLANSQDKIMPLYQYDYRYD